jgi:hypothetical protein
VKALSIFACAIIASSARATTVVLVSPSCSSSPHVVIAMTQSGKTMAGVHLDLYREIENGEKPYWTGGSDADGLAKLPELPGGRYRVFADAGKEGAGMSLLVSGEGQKTVRCEMSLLPLAVPETFATLAAGAPQIRLSEFRGVVQDETGAVIPRLKIEVRSKKFLDKGAVAEAQSDQMGQFILHREDGSYLAIFNFPGFRRRVVSFDVGTGGPRGLRLTMIVEGSSTSDPPLEEWSPAD